jgi:hypothetical protein
MNRIARYLIAVVASSTAAAASLVIGLIAGSYAIQHGIPNGFVMAVTISMVGVAALPAYIVKKLLVDYW